VVLSFFKKGKEKAPASTPAKPVAPDPDDNPLTQTVVGVGIGPSSGIVVEETRRYLAIYDAENGKSKRK